MRVNPKIAWSLGLGVEESFGKPAYWHWGDGPGFKNFAWVQPETQTALVFFTDGDHGQAAYSWAFRAVLGEDPAALAWI